jgi:hypothetical protein
MAYLKTLAECTYALLYGYGNRFTKRFKAWSEEVVVDEDEFL